MRTALLLKEPTIRIEAYAANPRPVSRRANAALDECENAWKQAHETARAKGYPASKALRMAAVAYKLAMPRMTSLAAIRAAIACIAQGIALEVFDGRDGSQLLYAAQVALTTVKARTGAK